jgi:hypothetical protein
VARKVYATGLRLGIETSSRPLNFLEKLRRDSWRLAQKTESSMNCLRRQELSHRSRDLFNVHLRRKVLLREGNRRDSEVLAGVP